MRKILVAIFPLLLLGGCGTCMSFQNPAPYGGVRLDAEFIANLYPSRVKDLDDDSRGWAQIFGVIGIFDLPFSAVADTLLLPVTVSALIEKTRATPAVGQE